MIPKLPSEDLRFPDDPEAAVGVDHQILRALFCRAPVEDAAPDHKAGLLRAVEIAVDGEDGVHGFGNARSRVCDVPSVGAVGKRGPEMVRGGETHVRDVHGGIPDAFLGDLDGDVPVVIAVLRYNRLRFFFLRGGKPQRDRRFRIAAGLRAHGLRLGRRLQPALDDKGVEQHIDGEEQERAQKRRQEHAFSACHDEKTPFVVSLSIIAAEP